MDLNSNGPPRKKELDFPEIPKTREQIIIGKIVTTTLIVMLISIVAGIIGFIIIALVAFARRVL